MGNSGFKCYVIYVSTVAHYSNTKFDITTGLLKDKKLVDSWNTTRFSTDGKLFQILADKYKPSELVKLFSYYFYHNQKKTHPSIIINDNFQLWESNKKSLIFSVENYIVDLIKIKSYCVKHNTKMKTLILSNSLFTLNLQFTSILVLNELFDIASKLEANSELEHKLIKNRKLYLDKTAKIFYNYIKDKDWKQITKDNL